MVWGFCYEFRGSGFWLLGSDVRGFMRFLVFEVRGFEVRGFTVRGFPGSWFHVWGFGFVVSCFGVCAGSGFRVRGFRGSGFWCSGFRKVRGFGGSDF